MKADQFVTTCRVARHSALPGGEVRGAGYGAAGEDAQGEGAGVAVAGGGVAKLQRARVDNRGPQGVLSHDGHGVRRLGRDGADGEAGDRPGRVRGASGEEQVPGGRFLQPGGSEPPALHQHAGVRRRQGRSYYVAPACERVVEVHLAAPLVPEGARHVEALDSAIGYQCYSRAIALLAIVASLFSRAENPSSFAL